MSVRSARIGVVSTGRVGATLAAALSGAGHQVVAVSARSEASRRRAASFVPDAAVLDPPAVAALADVLLLAVSDDALDAVVRALATTGGAVRPGQVVAHVSGVHGTAILAPVRTLGAQTVAICPAMTFTGQLADVQLLPGISYASTADGPAARDAAAGLVAALGGRPEWIAEDARALYHAAVVHGANHLVVLLAEAMELMAAAGVAEPGRVLGPISSAALGNALRLGDQALTGPVSRGDAGTVARHLTALSDAGSEHLQTYCCFAERAARRAVAMRRIDAEAAGRVAEILASAAGPADVPGAAQPG